MKKFLALCLAMLMAASLMSVPVFAASTVSDARTSAADTVSGTQASANNPGDQPAVDALVLAPADTEVPPAPVPEFDPCNPGDLTLTADDVLIEMRGEEVWINVFLPGQYMVTMSEQFVCDFAVDGATTANVKRTVTSNSGHIELAERVIGQLIWTGLMQGPEIDGSYAYNDQIFWVSTDQSCGMKTPDLVKFHTYVDVDVYVEGVVDLTVVHDGVMSMSCMTVCRYEEVVTNPYPANRYQIWAVKELDEDRIEVYLENGMIVSFDKAMVVDWMDNRYYLGGSFSLGCGSNDEQIVDQYGQIICLDFFQGLLDSLVVQGWTVYDDESLDPGYTYEAFPVQNVMRADRLAHDSVLTPALEEMRDSDTKAEVEMVFEWYDCGEFEHAVQYPATIEFIGYNNTGNGYDLMSWPTPGGFVYHFYQTRFMQINDWIIEDLMGAQP